MSHARRDDGIISDAPACLHEMDGGILVVPGHRSQPELETGGVVVLGPDNRVLRLGRDVGRLYQRLCAAPGASVAQLAPEWRRQDLMAALQSLESAGLIGWPNAEASVPVRTGRGAKERRFEFFNPAAVCRALARPAALLTGAGGFVLSTIGATAQLLFLIGFRADATPGAGANWVAAGLVALTLVLHEFAHGAVLARCGGAPKAMGAMLVCFVPVLFCDIADSLRLGRREQVKVALAGVALQCQVGAALLPAASLGPGAMATIRLYTTVNLVVAAVNLVPLVPLDGYLALRSALGVPNLRTLALAAWREAVANLFLRTRRSAAHLHRGQPAWMVAFGGACAAAPLLFLVVWSSRLAALLHDQAPETRSAVGIVAIAVTVGAAVIRMRKARRERVALS